MMEPSPSDPAYLNLIKTWGVDEKIIGTWEDVTAAGNTFTVPRTSGPKFEIHSKLEHEIPYLSPEVGRIRAAMIKLCDVWKVIDEDVENFFFNISVATHEIRLYDGYLPYNANLIQHDSSFESVMEKIPWNDYRECRRSQLKSIVQTHIKRAKFWHMNDLRYAFSLFLSDCDFLDTRIRADHDCFKKLMDDPRFTEMNFSDVPQSTLMGDLDMYLLRFGAVCPLQGQAKEEAKSKYRNVVHAYQQSEMLLYQEAREMVPFEFITPFHFLVRRKYSEGYKIGDPVIEIMKAHFYFGAFTTGVRRWTNHPHETESERMRRRERKISMFVSPFVPNFRILHGAEDLAVSHLKNGAASKNLLPDE